MLKYILMFKALVNALSTDTGRKSSSMHTMQADYSIGTSIIIPLPCVCRLFWAIKRSDHFSTKLLHLICNGVLATAV